MVFCKARVSSLDGFCSCAHLWLKGTDLPMSFTGPFPKHLAFVLFQWFCFFPASWFFHTVSLISNSSSISVNCTLPRQSSWLEFPILVQIFVMPWAHKMDYTLYTADKCHHSQQTDFPVCPATDTSVWTLSMSSLCSCPIRACNWGFYPAVVSSLNEKKSLWAITSNEKE